MVKNIDTKLSSALENNLILKCSHQKGGFIHSFTTEIYIAPLQVTILKRSQSLSSSVCYQITEIPEHDEYWYAKYPINNFLPSAKFF